MPTTIEDAEYHEVTAGGWESRLKSTHSDMVAKSVPAMLEFAKEVAEYKASCDTKQGGSEFSEKVQKWLGIGESMGLQWAAIGANSVTLSRSSLPPHMSTIYQLTTLPDDVLEDAIEDGTVNPGMTRADVQELKPKKEKREQTDKQKWAAALGVVRRAGESVPEHVIRLMIEELEEML